MLHNLIVSRAFAKGAGSCRMHLSEGFIANGPKDLEMDHAAYSLSLRLRLGGGGSMADVQVVYLVFLPLTEIDIVALLCT